MMNRRYDSQLASLRFQLDTMKARERISYETATLQEDIKKHLNAIISGDYDSADFFKRSGSYVLPQKWHFVLESLWDIRRRLEAENEVGFQNPIKSVKNPIISTVSEAWVHFDPYVLPDFAKSQTSKSQYLQGL